MTLVAAAAARARGRESERASQPADWLQAPGSPATAPRALAGTMGRRTSKRRAARAPRLHDVPLGASPALESWCSLCQHARDPPPRRPRTVATEPQRCCRGRTTARLRAQAQTAERIAPRRHSRSGMRSPHRGSAGGSAWLVSVPRSSSMCSTLPPRRAPVLQGGVVRVQPEARSRSGALARLVVSGRAGARALARAQGGRLRALLADQAQRH